MARTTINTQVIPDGTIVSADLSYPLTDFSSTGIDDNASSTSLTIDSSQNVGIGTASPSKKLHVSASGSSAQIMLESTNTANGQMIFKNASTTNNFYVGLLGDTSGDGFLYHGDAKNMQFWTNATERMRINSSGNVGIGTTSPTRDLQVEGVDPIIASIISNTTGAGIGFKDGTTSADNVNTIRAIGNQLQLRADNNLSILTNSSERMRIDNAGNLGLGNNDPSSYSFDTGPDIIIGDGTDNPHLSIVSPTTGTGYVAFADGTTGNERFRGLIEYAHSTDHMGLRTAGLERIRIDSSGNVGIGTSSPSEKLEVSAGTNLDLGVSQLSFDNFSNEGVGITFSRTTSTSRLSAIGITNTDSLTLASRNNVIFATGGGSVYSATTERMRIDSSGNVGIGTTSPVGPLHIQSATNRTIVLDCTQATGSFTWASVRRSGSEKFRWFINNDDSMSLYSQAGSLYAMTWLTNGNVGLKGITSPDALLTISTPQYSTSATDGMIKWYNSNGSGHSAIQGFWVSGAGSDLSIGSNFYWSAAGSQARWSSGLPTASLRVGRDGAVRVYTNTSAGTAQERFAVTSAGYVGIGTSSPSQTLHVFGAIRLTASGTDANRYNVYWNGSTGDFILVSSDARLKKDFDYDIEGIETVKNLKPLRFTWKEDNKKQLGFLAQESLEADEHLAWYDEENDQWGLDGWEGYAAVLTKAIQEQQAMIETLQAEVAALKGE